MASINGNVKRSIAARRNQELMMGHIVILETTASLDTLYSVTMVEMSHWPIAHTDTQK